MTSLRHPKLELNEDIPFQRKWWKIQRVCWGVVALTLLAAFTGALGDGPLSRTSLTSATGRVMVQFDRIVRRSSPDRVTILARKVAADGPVRLKIPRTFVEHADLQNVHPHPLRAEANGDSWLYYFSPHSGDDNLWIRFDLEYSKAGSNSGVFAMNDEEFVISQWVLP